MSVFAKPGNIGIRVYDSQPPSGYPFLVSESELTILVSEGLISNYFYNRMYCTIDEYVLEPGVDETMIEKRISRSLVYSTQTFAESQDGQ